MGRRRLVIAVDFTKYRGRYVALVDDRVVAAGRDARTVWKRAMTKKPSSVPTLVKIPKGETLVLIICA